MRKKIFFPLAAFFMYLGAYSQGTDSTKVPEADTEKIVFTRAEVEAAFPGGAQAFGEYLRKNLKADIPVKKKAPAGSYMVIVRFIVARDGAVSDVIAETRHGFGMEEEVIRVMKKSPDWIPARQNGRNVNAYRRQPVTFVVQEK